MSYDFYAYLNRMKYIKRWSLMHSVVEENIMEHSWQVAIIAHSLALIKNEYFGGNVDVEKTVMLSIYHESSEVITGDLPTPIKYFNKQINTAYKDLEENACLKLLSSLPEELKPSYSDILLPDKTTEEYAISKCADKLSAYVKCLEELKSKNSEFKKAKQTIEKELKSLNRKEVDYFMEKIIPSFEKTLDELQ